MVALLLAGGWFLATSSSWNRDPGPIGDDVVAQRIWSAQLAGDRPTPTFGNDTRLLAEVTPNEQSESYAFTNTNDDGSPIRYDPCRVISVVVNPAGAPSEYRSIVDRATRQVTEASGLLVEVVSETTEPPTSDRQPYNPDRYGDRWAPVLIAWTDSTVVPDLAGSVAGIGGSSWTSYDSEPGWYVSGHVYMDTELESDPAVQESVLLHELGHVLGLDHVEDSSQVMFRESTATRLGAGDLTGLSKVAPVRAPACSDSPSAAGDVSGDRPAIAVQQLITNDAVCSVPVSKSSNARSFAVSVEPSTATTPISPPPINETYAAVV